VPNPITTTDLADRWRLLTADEETVAQALLDDAWAVLLAQVPGIEARLEAGTLSEGWRQWSIDDASFTRDQSLSAGLLYLAPGESAELAPVPSSSASRGAYIISFGG
jgi:hypothetical protein